ncbi:hypothetical protein EXU85_05105 [Spirosoma sp. KCTC 42546]|uniref:hypothetical protein n=1 Tax=Spirosoma sp. KCTC 42546 TaxID=2520506 RepID=UPI0011591484|nr:hypothetical protein [Spirosoma sp. KCTC 42546]QDK78001.1 hypothetical protein EXU85_05105 [Spirosoma sp. KCTC 42546]
MTKLNKKILQSLGSGLVGACALTVLHETARQFIDEAPRADILGMRAIKKVMGTVDAEPPADEELHDWALGGDLVSNMLYYSLIGLAKPKDALLAGTALGAVAGVGAVGLPGPLGLGTAPSSRTPATAAMTIGWYLVGGLATAAAYRWLKRK